MSDAKRKKIGDLYKAIGEEIAVIVGDPDKTFLYVEAGEGWIGPSLFKDEGKQVQYYDANRKLNDLLLDVWEVEDPDKRWISMEYSVTGTKFQVTFKFADDFPPGGLDEIGSDDLRERILNARYGDKPRIYPPPEDLAGWLLRQPD